MSDRSTFSGMDGSFKICITFKFSDLVVRTLLSAGGPYICKKKRMEEKKHTDIMEKKKLGISNISKSKIKQFI